MWKQKGVTGEAYIPIIESVSILSYNRDLTDVPELLWLYGDINNDGKVDTTDGMAIYRKYANKTSAFEELN